MIVLQANSIKFVQQNDRLPSLDNTLSKDLEILNGLTYEDFAHKFIETDDVTTLVLCNLTETPTMTLIAEDQTETNVAGTLVATFTTSERKYYTFVIDISAVAERFSLKLESDDVDEDDWISEPCERIEYERTMQKIEWFSDTNDFDFYYEGGLVNFMWLDDNLFNGYAPSGSDTIFDNDFEKKKLYSVLYRTLKLTPSELPPTILEKVALAGKHKYFYVNEVEYTVEENLEATNLDFTNLNDGELVLTQTNVIGLSTHKIGFNCDNIVMENFGIPFQEEAASGSGSFTFLEGRILHLVTMYLATGVEATIKLGITPGGTEICETILTTESPGATEQVHAEIAQTGATTLYYEITGTAVTVDIYGHSLKNRT